MARTIAWGKCLLYLWCFAAAYFLLRTITYLLWPSSSQELNLQIIRALHITLNLLGRGCYLLMCPSLGFSAAALELCTQACNALCYPLLILLYNLVMRGLPVLASRCRADVPHGGCLLKSVRLWDRRDL